MNAHSFPAPGLGMRILGEVNKKLRQTEHIDIEELRKQNLYGEVSQVFAFFLSVRLVGVVGDASINLVDSETCGECVGTVKVIACIEDPQ